ncbi:MAG TPA: hypothetical protein VF796_03880 [Humisphaera sp.]
MTTDADTLVARARSGDRDAVADVFADAHPAVRRSALALTGDEGVADRVTADVFRHALNVLPRWSDEADPGNWFYHHTVLTARRLGGGRPESGSDPLVTALPEAARLPAYVAFARGIRRLPPQAAEAFLLHHGERLNPRLLGVAMDCSAAAATTHLAAADEAMRQLAGPDFEKMTTALHKAVAAMAPPAEESRRFAAARARAFAARRLGQGLKRLIVTLIVLAVLAAVAYLLREPIMKLTSGGT